MIVKQFSVLYLFCNIKWIILKSVNTNIVFVKCYTSPLLCQIYQSQLSAKLDMKGPFNLQKVWSVIC